jgi:hypothetical protein
MKFSEVATRLNGISTPIFGFSWQPPRSDVAAAREVITFLEDRAALYQPYIVENPQYVIASILSIRAEVTRVLAPGGLNTELMSSLRTIRAACRKFTNTLGARTDGNRLVVPPTAFGVGHMHDIGFNQALGELRGVVGTEVAKIAAAHGLDVEDGLASILPAADGDADDDGPTEVIIDSPGQLYVEPPQS